VPARLHLYPDRPDLRAVLEVDGRALTVIVAHPPPPRRHRDGLYVNPGTAAQVAALTALAAGDGPALLLGDLNLTPLHAGYGGLRRAGLRDAFAEAGRGFGFTLPRRWRRLPLVPFARIDYVWHTAHLAASRAWVGPDAGSDHLPVCARLHWR
jgi:endonuclease/exonuclease/phosphatase (EEP) superfamily protein YafD